MAKRDINIFSISILDILSGALGAIIILYVIMPKFTEDTLDQLKELESIDAAIVQVDKLEDMIKQLENSVDKELFQKIEEQIEELKQTIQTLKIEVKNIQKQLKQAQDKIVDLENTIKKKEEEIAKAKEEIAKAEEQIKKLQEEIEKLNKKNEELKAYKIWMANCGFDLKDECPSKVDIGFKFQGKKVLFLIDVSGSMTDQDQDGVDSQDEDRLSYVKSGIKMLITVMNKDFKYDVIKFPNRTYSDYKAKWGALRPSTDYNKNQMYTFIKNLEAYGGTPTRAVLKYALSHYPGLSDIVLLTDGEPSRFNSSANAYEGDNINDILREIKRLNTSNVRINAFGVGADFYNDPNSDKVRFLKELCKQNGKGFFVDFY